MLLQPTLSQLAQKKLWIVTGKGGVGKTTLTAALGILCAAQGLKTLLVETHGLTHLGDLFEVGRVGYDGQKIRKDLHLVQITPEEALKEYLLQQVHFQFIYNAVFNNRYVRHFLDAAPGLIELLTIGKIWSLVDNTSRKILKKNYDVVIVDAPATGHGLSLLKVPQVVVDAVRVGPLKTQSQKILDLLQDPNKTLVWLVTLAEEMPVSEAIDMTRQLTSDLKMQLAPLTINAEWPQLLTSSALKELNDLALPWPAVEIYEKRLRQSQFYIEKIKKQLAQQSFMDLPLIYENPRPLLIAESLAQSLQAQLS